MKVKISCSWMVEEIDDAEMVTLESPAWAKKYKFMTHIGFYNFGSCKQFNFSEFSTGCGCVGGILSESRGEAVLRGIKTLTRTTEEVFLKRMRKHPTINYEPITEPPAGTETSEDKPCAGPTS